MKSWPKGCEITTKLEEDEKNVMSVRFLISMTSSEQKTKTANVEQRKQRAKAKGKI